MALWRRWGRAKPEGHLGTTPGLTEGHLGTTLSPHELSYPILGTLFYLVLRNTGPEIRLPGRKTGFRADCEAFPTRIWANSGPEARFQARNRYRCLRNKCPSKPKNFIGFGAMDVTESCEFIWFGDIHGTKPYKFMGFRWAFVSQTPVSR